MSPFNVLLWAFFAVAAFEQICADESEVADLLEEKTSTSNLESIEWTGENVLLFNSTSLTSKEDNSIRNNSQEITSTEENIIGNTNGTELDSSNSTFTPEENVSEGVLNGTTVDVNTTIANVTDWADSRGNESALPSIMEPGVDEGVPSVGTTASAIILAGVFVVLAAGAFAGMLMWRRMLQVRYGNSAMLITEDVYDISDLRNFEI